MNPAGMVERVLRGVFWTLTLVLPLILYWEDHGFGTGPEPGAGDGLGWLALPARISERSIRYPDWKRLERKELRLAESLPDSPEMEERGPDAEPRSTTSARKPFRIRVHGHLGEGVDKVYLFFDTENRRWFRLMAGEVDRKAGVSLRLSGVAGGVKLVALDGDGEFAVDEGKGLLARVVQ